MLILRDAFRGLRRFDDFQQSLGIARNLLTDRLCRLVDHEVLEKVPYQDHPVRFDYRLTAKGLDLSQPLVALMRWGDQWESSQVSPPVVLVHEACGTAVAQELVCWHCDTTITPAELRNKNTLNVVDQCNQPAEATQAVHVTQTTQAAQREKTDEPNGKNSYARK